MMSSSPNNDTNDPAGDSREASPTRHLGYLKFLYRVWAILSLFGSVYYCFSAWFTATTHEAFEFAGLFSLIYLFGSVVIFDEANKVGRGQGRFISTIWAMLLLRAGFGLQCLSFYWGTLGTLPMIAALYILWVCWINEDTKAIFDRRPAWGLF